jgi:membrane-associated phospholipid phosphatase
MKIHGLVLLHTAMQRTSLLSLIAVLPACATLPNGHGWGQDATLSPGWERMQTAVIEAASSPITWVPLVAAGLLQIDNVDHNLSRLASDNTPIFGSQQTADTISTGLMGASIGLYVATALPAPSGEEQWLANKAKEFGVGLGAQLTAAYITEGLKTTTGRQRPDERDHSSFPSGHASTAAVSATLAADNIDTLQIPASGRIALKGLGAGLAVGTAYARVEAKKHFTSDVLVGAALGHFIGVFANEAFLGIDRPYQFSPNVYVSRDSFLIGINGRF